MIEKYILVRDTKIEIEPGNFSEEAGSTILVKERLREIKRVETGGCLQEGK